MKLMVWLLLGLLVLIATGTFALIHERHAQPEESRLKGDRVQMAKLPEGRSEPAPHYACSDKLLSCPTKD
jgi:hypothetical protein